MSGFKRKVFYVGGFDPRGVRFYHGLYKEAAARWSALTGRPLALSPRRRVSPIRVDWTIANPSEDAETSYSFLRWEDLVQRAWIKGPMALIRAGFRTYDGHRKHMDHKALMTLPRAPIITLWYPPVASILVPLLIALIPFLIGLIVLPWWVALPLALGIGFAAAQPVLKRWHVFWLMRFFIFNADHAGGEDDEAIAARLDDFAAEILPELDGDWDEVLLISHSNGSILSVPLMTRLLAARGQRMPDRFALVTLGQCIPLVSHRRDAVRFRAQLAGLAAAHFRWIDIGSPPDGAAYYGVDPMARVAATHSPDLQHFSPRFHLFYDPATYHKGWSSKYDIHFDYLRVGDRVSPMDFPTLTASGRPIAASIAEFRALP